MEIIAPFPRPLDDTLTARSEMPVSLATSGTSTPYDARAKAWTRTQWDGIPCYASRRHGLSIGRKDAGLLRLRRNIWRLLKF